MPARSLPLLDLLAAPLGPAENTLVVDRAHPGLVDDITAGLPHAHAIVDVLPTHTERLVVHADRLQTIQANELQRARDRAHLRVASLRQVVRPVAVDVV